MPTTICCQCGKVACEIASSPLFKVECCCEEYRQAGEWIEVCGGKRWSRIDPVEAVYYSNDVEVARGAEHLGAYVLRGDGHSVFLVATCCHTTLLVDEPDFERNMLLVFPTECRVWPPVDDISPRCLLDTDEWPGDYMLLADSGRDPYPHGPSLCTHDDDKRRELYEPMIAQAYKHVLAKGTLQDIVDEIGGPRSLGLRKGERLVGVGGGNENHGCCSCGRVCTWRAVACFFVWVFLAATVAVFFVLCFPELRRSMAYLPATCQVYSDTVLRPEARPVRHCLDECQSAASASPSTSPTSPASEATLGSCSLDTSTAASAAPPCAARMRRHAEVNAFDVLLSPASRAVEGTCAGEACCARESCDRCTRYETRCHVRGSSASSEQGESSSASPITTSATAEALRGATCTRTATLYDCRCRCTAHRFHRCRVRCDQHWRSFVPLRFTVPHAAYGFVPSGGAYDAQSAAAARQDYHELLSVNHYQPLLATSQEMRSAANAAAAHAVDAAASTAAAAAAGVARGVARGGSSLPRSSVANAAAKSNRSSSASASASAPPPLSAATSSVAYSLPSYYATNAAQGTFRPLVDGGFSRILTVVFDHGLSNYDEALASLGRPEFRTGGVFACWFRPSSDSTSTFLHGDDLSLAAEQMGYKLWKWALLAGCLAGLGVFSGLALYPALPLPTTMADTTATGRAAADEEEEEEEGGGGGAEGALKSTMNGHVAAAAASHGDSKRGTTPAASPRRAAAAPADRGRTTAPRQRGVSMV